MKTNLKAAVATLGLAFAATGLAAPVAQAATAPATLPAGQYTLTADYSQFDTIGNALVSRLGTAAVHTVMENANHDRTALPSSFSVP